MQKSVHEDIFNVTSSSHEGEGFSTGYGWICRDMLSRRGGGADGAEVANNTIPQRGSGF